MIFDLNDIASWHKTSINQVNIIDHSLTIVSDNCLRWRTLPFSSNNIGKDFEDDWVCAMNPDVQHNKYENMF